MLRSVVLVSILVLHCQCAFWGLSTDYDNVISINAETGVSEIIGSLPKTVAFNGGAQCVADPVNKVLYFIGGVTQSFHRSQVSVIGVSLASGEIVSTTPLPNYDCCSIYVTFIAKNQILVVGPNETEDKYIVSMVYVDTNEVVELANWSSPAMMFSGVGPGVFDSQNGVAWVQLPYNGGYFNSQFHDYTMNMGFNILTNETLHLNDTYDNWYLAYSSGYVVGMAGFDVDWQYPPGEQVGSFGLSRFNSTGLEEELYVFPIEGGWNVLGSNIAVDPTIGTNGTIYAVLSANYAGYYWTSIDIATGAIGTKSLLNNGDTFLPPYGCIVYTS